ncbi:NADH:flavin oxidoreductase [Pseudoduganella sp. UC29_106]|uniref:oxidoreductase n=1 Tax=Pseudoduganella sp. UC29_106 TaxID=3374553 RepID=UPI003757ADED
MTAAALQPFKLAGLTLHNRIVKAATFEGRTPGGEPGPELAAFHARFAKGGTALTTVSYCAVSPDARTFEDQLYLHEGVFGGIKALAEAVHAEGGAVSGQLAHCGGFKRNTPVEARRPLGPSGGINQYGLLSGVPLSGAMGKEDFARVVRQYGESAHLLRRAGFDALEIHMGHGYLLSQFLSPASNRRTDEYGGSLPNRMRFPLQVLAAVRAVVGDDFPILCKINLADGFDGGMTLDDCVQACRLLEQGGIDAIELSGGYVSRTPMYLFGGGGSPLPAMIRAEASSLHRLMLRLGGGKLFPSLPYRDLYFLEQARRVRDAVQVPLVYLGGASSAAHIETALAAGFDLVALGRALLYDPDLCRRLASEPEYQSGCTHCNGCVASMALPGGTRCTYNV